MRRSGLVKGTGVAFVAWVLVVLAFWGTLAWIAWHFISKFW